MTTFEEIGRKLDRELEKLREVAERKLSPGTRRKAATSLRKISDTLARVATELESNVAPKQE